jgi:photosystem II stability/assembly factor-like uncharacterized protein
MIGCAVLLPAATATAAGSWTVSQTGPKDDTYTGIDFLDALWGWTATQGYAGAATVSHTTDGGSTWPVVATPGPTPWPEVQDLSMAGSYTGIAAGAESTILRTTDMGATWTDVRPTHPVPVTFYSVDYANSMRAYVGGMLTKGEGGKILMTIDAGSTWVDRSPQGLPRGAVDVRAVDFVDGAHGWALVKVAGDLKILATTDMGRTWKATSLGIDSTPRDVYFYDAQRGWALAGYYDEHLFRTTDGGTTWTSLTLPDLFDPMALCFVTPTIGYMGTGLNSPSNTVIWKTNDAGTSWTPACDAPNGSISIVWDLDFTDPDHGWASGEINGYATVLKYTSSDPLPTPAAPITIVSGVSQGAWYNHDVTALFEASIGFGGGFVKRIDWYTDLFHYGSGLGDILSETFYAATDHHLDGTYPVSYYATDSGGRQEAAKLVTFGIDTVQPATQASAAAAKRGRAVTLKYKITDAALCGPLAKTATIKVKNKSGKVAKTVKYTNKWVNTPLTAKFTVPRTWKPGTYKYLVYATDNAGNPQGKIGTNKLVVR